MRHNSPSFFILSDNALAGIPRNKIVQQLAEVGFDEELQRQAKELKRAPKPVKILLLGELHIF